MDKHNLETGKDELFDLSTESESSVSSNPYESQPLILELHEISKENPAPETQRKIRKNKKKKKNRSQASVSSGSTANSVTLSQHATDELPREEFYDAHGSYHALPENEISNPVATAALAQAHSEHGQEPKVQEPLVLAPTSVQAIKVQEDAPAQGQTVEAPKQPSAIIKPVTGPE